MDFSYMKVILVLLISVFCMSIYGCADVGRNISESVISEQIENPQQELNKLTAENKALKQEINLLKVEIQNQQKNTDMLLSDKTEQLKFDIEDRKQSASTEEFTHKFPVDISLILEDSDENRAKYMELFPCKTVPCLATFTHQNQRLTFLASKHSLDPNSMSHQLVNRAFEELNPDYLIIEGFSIHDQIPGEQQLEEVCSSTLDQRCAEQVYAMLVSYRNSVPFIGGEPTKYERYKSIRQAGFGNEDYYYYKSLQLINVLINRETRSPADNLEELFSKRIETTTQDFIDFQSRFNRELSIDADAPIFKPNPFYDFMALYETRHQKTFEWTNNITQTYYWNRPDNKTLYGQMAAVDVRTREINLLTEQSKALDVYDSILVVYGAGHLFVETLQHKEWFKGNVSAVYD